MRAVRSLLEGFYSIELRAVGIVRRIARYSIELGVVRRMLRENTRYLIELRVVRSLLEGFPGIR